MNIGQRSEWKGWEQGANSERRQSKLGEAETWEGRAYDALAVSKIGWNTAICYKLTPTLHPTNGTEAWKPTQRVQHRTLHLQPGACHGQHWSWSGWGGGQKAACESAGLHWCRFEQSICKLWWQIWAAHGWSNGEEAHGCWEEPSFGER